MNRIKCFIGVVVLIMLVMSGCSVSEGTKAETYVQITMDEAVQMMENETNYIILDVRTEAEYNAGHIPNAICIPNETIVEDNITELPDKEQRILVYCRSGNRSKQASDKLARFGYTNVYEFGGIIDWQGETVSESN